MASIGKILSAIFPYIYSNKNNNNLKMLGATTIDIVTSAINVVTPVLIADYINKQVKKDEEKSPDWGLEVYLPILGTLFLATYLFPKLRSMLINSVRANVQKELTMSMVKKSYAIELDHLLTTSTGDFSQTLTKNYITIDKIMPSFFSEIVPITMEVLGATAVLSTKYGLIGVSQPSILAFYLLVAILREKTAKEVKENCMNMSFEAYGVIIDTIQNYQIAHQFGNTKYELDKTDASLILSESLYRQSHQKDDRNALLLSLINAIGFVAVIALAGLKPPTANFDQVDFSLLAYYMFRFNSNLEILPRSISALHAGIVDSEKLVEFLHRESKVADPKNPQPLNIVNPPSIEFRNVSFNYGSKEILKNISFTIQPGHKVAIVGPTGGGKSTIIKLLQRFYAVTQGGIFINGIDISNVLAKKLRENIAVVSQETGLFSGSIAQNIKYGDFTAGEADVTEAAKFAELIGAEEQKKLHMDVGQHGNKLAGGEKQRTSIARALLKGGFIYLFDEPTSALDAKTEYEVQKMLDGLTAKVSTLVITHRLNTIINADQILYLEDGIIIERGNFNELMGEKGKFYEQFNVQCHDLGIAVEEVKPVQREAQYNEGFYLFWQRRQHVTTKLNASDANLANGHPSNYLSFSSKLKKTKSLSGIESPPFLSSSESKQIEEQEEIDVEAQGNRKNNRHNNAGFFRQKCVLL